jgi:hypothetical protein
MVELTERLAPAIETNDRCEIAKANYWAASRNLELWDKLVFAMGCAFAVFLLAGIVLVAIGSDTRGAGIVSFVGTVASGVAMTWIVKRRNTARTEKNAAADLVGTYCPAGTVEQLG